MKKNPIPNRVMAIAAIQVSVSKGLSRAKIFGYGFGIGTIKQCLSMVYHSVKDMKESRCLWMYKFPQLMSALPNSKSPRMPESTDNTKTSKNIQQ